MNVLSFRSGIIDDNLVFTPCVDGVPLDVATEEFEKKRGYKDPAGGYGGLVPGTYEFRSFVGYFMGDEGVYGHPAGTVFLLFCGCGEAGCWPLQARITTSHDRIIWSDFAQPYRPVRDYSGFGPFAFQKEVYEATIREVASHDVFAR